MLPALWPHDSSWKGVSQHKYNIKFVHNCDHGQRASQGPSFDDNVSLSVTYVGEHRAEISANTCAHLRKNRFSLVKFTVFAADYEYHSE